MNATTSQLEGALRRTNCALRETAKVLESQTPDDPFAALLRKYVVENRALLGDPS